MSACEQVSGSAAVRPDRLTRAALQRSSRFRERVARFVAGAFAATGNPATAQAATRQDGRGRTPATETFMAGKRICTPLARSTPRSACTDRRSGCPVRRSGSRACSAGNCGVLPWGVRRSGCASAWRACWPSPRWK